MAPPKLALKATPFILIYSCSASASDASPMVEAYVKNSDSNAYMHPDSCITTEGIKFPSNRGTNGAMALQSMRRIAASFRGEYMEPEAPHEIKEESDDDTVGFGLGNQDGVKKELGKDDDWQDMAEYQLDQGGLVPIDQSDRTNAVLDGTGVEPEVQATNGTPKKDKKRKREGSNEEVNGDVLDKEARKRAKKARNQQQKRDKEKARAEKTMTNGV